MPRTTGSPLITVGSLTTSTATVAVRLGAAIRLSIARVFSINIGLHPARRNETTAVSGIAGPKNPPDFGPWNMQLITSVARISEAKSGDFSLCYAPACRCAHAGYLLRPRETLSAPPSRGNRALLRGSAKVNIIRDRNAAGLSQIRTERSALESGTNLGRSRM